MRPVPFVLTLLAMAGCGGTNDMSGEGGCSSVAAVVDGTWIDGAGCELAEPLADNCGSIANHDWTSCPTFDDVLSAIGWPNGSYGVVVQSCAADRDQICWEIPPDGEDCAIFDADGALVQLQKWGSVTEASPYSVCCDGHMISPLPVYGDPAARCIAPTAYVEP